MPPSERTVRLPRGQAIFYIATGVWPLVSIRSFEAVIGPKVDRWLVKTVGALVAGWTRLWWHGPAERDGTGRQP